MNNLKRFFVEKLQILKIKWLNGECRHLCLGCPYYDNCHIDGHFI